LHPSVATHTLGDLSLSIYTYENKDDVLPMHTHNRETIHITIVAKGSVKVHGPSIPETEYKAGSVVDFKEDHPHEITAMEDNSRIINIKKWIKDENKQ
jgi:quercetin dioxygenase-like cupin family protein